MKKYEYAGLTKELHQRLTLEFDDLREEHRRTLTKYIMETKKCNRMDARKYLQRFDNVVKERSKLSPLTLEDMREYLTALDFFKKTHSVSAMVLDVVRIHVGN